MWMCHIIVRYTSTDHVLIFTIHFPQKSPTHSSSFAKRALYIVALLRKETCNWSRLMHLRHPVSRCVTNVNALQVSFRERATNYRALLREQMWMRHVFCQQITIDHVLILTSHFPQKSPIISSSFAERDLQRIHICDITWCRVVKMHKMPQLVGLFPQKCH